MPESVRNCFLVPIPQEPERSSHLRLLAPTISKTLEWAILIEFSQFFPLAAFSFVSRKVCLPGVLKNTISQYIHHGPSVFSCFLDASKAFDLVDHGILFKKLMARGLPPVITRTILSWYVDQSMRVRWNCTLSLPFQVSNGVRQGGVLCPILFTMYVDDLYFLACNNWVLAVIGVQILLVQFYTQVI